MISRALRNRIALFAPLLWVVASAWLSAQPRPNQDYVEIEVEGKPVRLEKGQTYHLRGGGTLHFSVEQGVPAPPPEPDGKGSSTEWLVFVLGIGIALGVTGYFLVYVPWVRRKPLREAVDIIMGDDLELFEKAEELLSEALSSGMKGKDLSEAFFALSYVRARTNRLEEAAAALANSKRTDRSVEAIYLGLWIKSRRGEHENVEHVFDRHGKRLDDFLQSRLIIAIAYLERAHLLWRQNEIEEAMGYYARLRELKLLEKHIPTQVEDHQITLGIQSLYQGETDKARGVFEGIREAESPEPRTLVKARLGILLCTWKDEESPDIDEELTKVLDTLDTVVSEQVSTPALSVCPNCAHEYLIKSYYVDETVRCSECRERFKVVLAQPEAEDELPEEPTSGESEADQASGVDGESEDLVDAVEEATSPPEVTAPLHGDRLLNELDLLHRNVSFWHVASLLFTWRQLPEGEGLAQEELKALRRRVDCVTGIDDEFADAKLVLGLMLYYFHRNEEELTEGYELIEELTRSQVSLAEVIDLRERHRRYMQAREDSLVRFYGTLQDYMVNDSIPDERRRQLRKRLNRFSRFKEMVEGAEAVEQGDQLASTQDIGIRTALARRRVQEILQRNLPDADEKSVAEIKAFMEKLNTAADTLKEDYSHLEDAEFDLIGRTGEFLFREEERTESEQQEGE